MADPQGDIIIAPENPSCSILIAHGYSGGNDSFGELATALSQECNAQVLIPLLPGHGATDGDLIPYSLSDFVDMARRMAAKRAPDVPFICMGYCYGGYVVGSLARELHADALVFAITPYSPRFPLSLPGIPWLFSLFPLLKKPYTREDIEFRKGIFYYRKIPGKSLYIMREGIQVLDTELPKCHVPILTLHNIDDPADYADSGARIIAKAPENPLSKSVVFKRGRHTMFFGPYRAEPIRTVVDFVRSVVPDRS